MKLIESLLFMPGKCRVVPLYKRYCNSMTNKIKLAKIAM